MKTIILKNRISISKIFDSFPFTENFYVILFIGEVRYLLERGFNVRGLYFDNKYYNKIINIK